MHSTIADHRAALAELCERFDVARLEVFGSAARGVDFDPTRSDADFLVTFKRTTTLRPLQQLVGFADALTALLGRPVDLIERQALEQSRNYIRRRAILADSQVVYG